MNYSNKNMDEAIAVHQCVFCEQTFSSAADKDDHILEHFARETCTECNQNLIRIGGYLYARHNEDTCIKKVSTSEEHDEMHTTIESVLIKPEIKMEPVDQYEEEYNVLDVNHSESTIPVSELKPSKSINIFSNANVNLNSAVAMEDIFEEIDIAQEPERKRQKVADHLEMDIKEELVEADEYERMDELENILKEPYEAETGRHSDESHESNLGIEFKSESCEVRFAKAWHMKDHTVKKHVCPTEGCGKTFMSQSVFEVHQSTAHYMEKTTQIYEDKNANRGKAEEQVQKFNCSKEKQQTDTITPNKTKLTRLCEKEVFHIENIEYHQARFRPGSAFKCQICGKLLAKQSDLEAHLKHIHNIKKYKCSCGSSFGKRTDLDIHVKRMHSKVKTSGDLQSTEMLKNHTKTVQTAKIMFKCGICSKELNFEWQLVEHMRSEHQQNNDSSKEKEQNLTETPTEQNLVVKYQKCGHCGVLFRYEKALKSHLLKYHNASETFTSLTMPVPDNELKSKTSTNILKTRSTFTNANLNSAREPESKRQKDHLEEDIKEDLVEMDEYGRTDELEPVSKDTETGGYSKELHQSNFEIESENESYDVKLDNINTKESQGDLVDKWDKANAYESLDPHQTNNKYGETIQSKHDRLNSLAIVEVERNLFKCTHRGCEWYFRTHEAKLRHMKTHNVKKHVCSIDGCEKQFMSLFDLEVHQSTVHNMIEATQQNKFNDSNKEQDDMPTLCEFKSAGHEVLFCITCDEKFVDKRFFREHLEIVHSNNVKYKCGICYALFKNKSHLVQHELIHNEFTPHKCTFNCGQSFRSAWQRRYHEQTHNNEKFFVCDIEHCGKAFVSSARLKNHKSSQHSTPH